jgi:hypothetical protein
VGQNDQNIDPNSVRDGGNFSQPSSVKAAPQSLSLEDESMTTGSLLGQPETYEPLPAAPTQGNIVLRILKRTDVLIALIMLFTVGTLLILNSVHKKSNNASQANNVASQYNTQQIPLGGFIIGTNGTNFNSSVAINGLLTANSGIVLSPSLQPSTGTAGQLYYDQNTNQVAYYNGTAYIPLVGGPTVQNIGGVSGALTLGGGLSIIGNQLSVVFPANATFPDHVSSFGGQSGAITVGRGLAMNGSDLQNSGVLNIAAGTPNLVVSNDGNGNVTISSVGGGSGTVTSTGGTAGRIAKFTGVQDVEDSLLSESGATITVNGNLSVTGTISLAAPLTVANGGTGAVTLATNGVVIGQGTGTLTAVTAAGSGLCLISTVGAPSFQACPGGGGVTTLDSLAGALTIANTTGAGNTITIDDATTGAKGIATFNSTNLSVTAGSVNTVQNINMTATPTFTGVNTNTITPSGALTVGATGQNFTLQGATGSTITATNGGNTTTLSFQPATANVNYRFATTAAGTYDICTTAGNCVGVGGAVTTPGGTVNRLAKFTGAQTLADSIISDNGTLATITGNASITGSLTLGTALGVANGGTGTAALTANGVVIGQGSGALTTVTAAGSGLCLISTVGAPVFTACPGSGGVTSVNGLTGAISIANASGAGATITINDATTGAKGIASFNNTNFSVTGGAVNTIQDINSGAAPTFGQLTLTSSQATNPMLLINNTNTGGTGALLDLQVNGSSKFSVQPNGNTAVSGTVNGQTISGSASFTGSMAIAGNTTLTGDIAVNGGDITSSGALNITPGGTLTIGSGAQTLALQGGAGSTFAVTNGGNTTTINFQAPTANVTYRVPTAAAGTYDLCTTAGNCVGSGGGVTTSGGTTNRLAKFSGLQAIGDSTITDNGTTVTTTANMVVQGGTLTSGVANSQTGSLVLAYGGANFSGTITPGTLTANRTYTLPDASGTFCLNGSSACGFITGSGAAFVQGGNTFGVDGDLGTNDATALNLRTGGVTRVTISAAGNASFTGDIAVNGGDITSSGALNVTPSGTLTLGSGAQTLAMQGGSSSSLAITNGGNTTTVNFQAPTANVTYRFATAAAGSYDVCTTTGNCAGTGGGVTTPGGTNNKVAKFTGAQTLGDSSITDNGTTVTTSTNFVIQGGTGTIGVAGSQNGALALVGGNFTGSISTASLTGSQTYTLPDSSGTFCLSTGNCLGPVGNGANVSLSNLSSVAINTSLLPGATTIDLGAAGNGFRNLYLAGSSGSPVTNYFQITGAATGSRTITLPDASGTICLSGTAACGFATGSGAAFVQGGNTFGAAGNLGTNDSNALNLRTNGTTRITIAANGSDATFASNMDLLMQGATAYISNPQGTANGEAFGMGAATSDRSVGVGTGANGGGNDSVAVGYNSVTNSQGVAIGSGANAANTAATAVGSGAVAQYNGTSLGYAASAYNMSVAIGSGATVGGTSSIALGTDATTTASNQMVIGADGFEIDHIYVGSGVADATPTGFTLQGTGGSGSNVAGASVTLAGGAGTGNANGGSLIFQVAKPGTAGSSANVPTTVLSLSGADGSAQFKSTSTVALEVQNATGTPVFTVNTSTPGTTTAGTSTATGNINSSGGALQTAGTTRVDNSGNLTNIGNITGSGAMAITASGTMTVGNTGQTLALQGNASTTLSATGGGFTTTVGFTGSPTGAVSYNFDRAAAAGTYTICTSVGNCSGAAATLQSVYNNSTNPEIVVDATRGALTLRDNASAIGANLFEVQSNNGATTYLGVSASGISVSGAATVTGNINSSGGALQTAGTTRVDNSGNLTNIGNLTAAGAITIASTGAGNDIIIDGADQFIVQDVAVFNGLATFNTDADFTLAGTENVAITTTVTGTTAINMVDGTFTNNTTSGTQNAMQVQNAPGTGTTESLLVLDNADTDTAVTTGLLVTSAAGAITTALDVSDAEIGTALNFGANTIVGTTGDIDTTYFDVTGSTGSFTSAGTGTLQGGTITVGTAAQAGSAVLYDGTSNTGTIQTAALATNQTYTLPATGGTFCIQSSAACGFATGSSASYIQNQSASQQPTSSFWVSSASRIDGTLSVPTVSAPSGDLTLQSATNVLALNGIDTVLANGTLTLQSGGTNSINVNAGGTGIVNVGTTSANKTINLGVSGATANTTILNLATSTGAAQTVNIGSGTSGTAANGTTVLVQGGNGATAIGIQGLAGSTISIGTAAAATLALGNASGTINLNGTVQVVSLAAVTANSRTVCRDDTTGKLVVCDASIGSTLPFLQNGNSFGTTAVLGTNDANNLQIKVNGGTRATFDQSGYNLYLGNGITSATPSGFTVASTASSAAGTGGSGLVLQGGAGASATTGSSGGDITIAGGSAGGSGNNVGGTVLLQGGARTGTGAPGAVLVKNSANSVAAFQVQNAGGNPIMQVDAVNNRVGINVTGNPVSTLQVTGTLRLDGAATENYVTPLGTSVNTKINIVNFNPGGFGQVLALGLPSTATDTARALSLFDGRTVAHQPTLAVLSPDENNIIGLSWNGVSTTGYLMTTDSGGGSGTKAISVRSGHTSAGGNSGDLLLQSGDIAGGTGNSSGAVWLTSGVGTGTNASSGNITIDSGTSTGSGTTGTINVGTTNAASLLLGRGAGTTTLQGTVKLSTVGATTANAASLCRDTSTTNLISCDANTSGKPFLQGGNSFGATAVLGTNDTNNLSFATNGVVRGTFDQSNGLYLGNGVTAATPSNFTVAGTGSSTAGTAGANLTLQGGAGATTTTGSVGGQLKLVGGSAGGSGNNNGGDVLIQGGAPINVGSGGQVVVRNQGDTTGAFQVQAAGGGTPILNVDSVNGRVGIGGVASFSKFEVLGGDAAVYNSGNNPRLVLGDTTVSGQYGYLQWDSTGDYLRIETAGTNGVKINDNFLSIGNIFPSQPLIVGNGTTNLFQINTAGVASLIGGQTADITTAGAATATALTLQPGTSSGASANGPATNIKGGNASGTTSVTGGAVNIQAGNATGASGTRNGGSVTIDAGTGATANGAITIGGTNATSVLLGRTGNTVAMQGSATVASNLTVTGQTSTGTFTGAGLTDCDGMNSKLLWDATTSTFLCGTDKPNVIARKASAQTSNSLTYVSDPDFTFTIAAGETWAYQINTSFKTNDTTTANGSDTNPELNILMSSTTGATCRHEVNDLYMVQNVVSTSCTTSIGEIDHAGDTNDQQYLMWGTIVGGSSSSTVTLQFRRATGGTGIITHNAGGFMTAYKLTGVDLAEAYYTKDSSIAPGDIVQVDGSLAAGVQKTDRAYSSSALGIVSTQPGLILGSAADAGAGTPVLLALSGRVPLKVSMENGPIQPGDYLTSSSTPGVAMKATQPGQMIGKALEGFSSANPNAQGVVTTFANLTWANPNSGVTANNTLQGTTTIAGDLNVSGTVTTENLTVTGKATIKNLVVGSMTAQEITVSGTAKLAGDLQFQGVGQSRNAITKRFKASKPIPIGAVVIVDPANDGQVTTTTTAADTRVIGVALTAAQQAGDEIDVAIGGSVQVRTANGAQIQGGDTLVSATEDGTVTKPAAPTPGSLIGKALGKPDGDGGLVWTLITLQ